MESGKYVSRALALFAWDQDERGTTSQRDDDGRKWLEVELRTGRTRVLAAALLADQPTTQPPPTSPTRPRSTSPRPAHPPVQ